MSETYAEKIYFHICSLLRLLDVHVKSQPKKCSHASLNTLKEVDFLKYFLFEASQNNSCINCQQISWCLIWEKWLISMRTEVIFELWWGRLITLNPDYNEFGYNNQSLSSTEISVIGIDIRRFGYKRKLLFRLFTVFVNPGGFYF